MWASDWGRQVVSGERFRRYEKPVGTLERQKTGKEPRGQLSVTMADNPDLGELSLERAHDSIPRGSRDLDVAQLELAKLFFRRGANLQWTLDGVHHNVAGAGTCLAPLECTIPTKK
jgi:hypothetical protein